jgi:hypothetical protein
VFEPVLEDYSFITPRDSNAPLYAVSVKYRINGYTREGQLFESWTFTGYGSVESSTLGLKGTNALKQATQLAMRDAAAKLAAPAAAPSQPAAAPPASGQEPSRTAPETGDEEHETAPAPSQAPPEDESEAPSENEIPAPESGAPPAPENQTPQAPSEQEGVAPQAPESEPPPAAPVAAKS